MPKESSLHEAEKATAPRIKSGSRDKGVQPGSPETAALFFQQTAGNRALTSLLEPSKAAPEPVRRALDSSTGEKLPEDVRETFSRKFGRTLDDVTVHRDAQASEAARAIEANAFAHGSQIFFREGMFQPDSHDGQALLAHELTHVIQQTGNGRAAGSSESELHARQASADQSRGGQSLNPGPSAPVGVAADNGVVYEDEERGQSVLLSTRNEVLDTILDTEAEADRRRALTGVTDLRTAELDERATQLRTSGASSKAEKGMATPQKPDLPVASPDLRDASAGEIRAHRRQLLETQLASKDPEEQKALTADIANTNDMLGYAAQTYSIVVGGHEVHGLREHQARKLAQNLLSDLESDTQLLQFEAYRNKELRAATTSWVTGPTHFWGGAWNDIEPEQFQETNQLRAQATLALKEGRMEEATRLLSESYEAYRAVKEQFGEYQAGIQKGGSRMVRTLSVAETAGQFAASELGVGGVYNIVQAGVEHEEMERRGLLEPTLDIESIQPPGPMMPGVPEVPGEPGVHATEPRLGTLGEQEPTLVGGEELAGLPSEQETPANLLAGTEEPEAPATLTAETQEPTTSESVESALESGNGGGEPESAPSIDMGEEVLPEGTQIRGQDPAAEANVSSLGPAPEPNVSELEPSEGGVATREPPSASAESELLDEIDEQVERGIIEEVEDTERASRPRPQAPATRGAGAEARDNFANVRDGYAEELGVGPGGQVHHAVELQTLDKYPGVYTEAELNDIENMRGIPAEDAGRRQLHNSKIREVLDRNYRALDAEISAEGLTPGTPEYNTLVRSWLTDASAEVDWALDQFFSENRAEMDWGAQ